MTRPRTTAARRARTSALLGQPARLVNWSSIEPKTFGHLSPVVIGYAKTVPASSALYARRRPALRIKISVKVNVIAIAMGNSHWAPGHLDM